MTDRNDEQWLTQLRAQGQTQQRALEDLGPILHRGLRKALRHERGLDDAFLEDVVQDALVRIVDRLDQFAGQSRFTTWAMTVAIRGALSDLRRRRWRDVSLDQMSETLPGHGAGLAIDQHAGPDRQIEQTALLDDLRTAIEGSLTQRQRQALLADLEGQSSQQIADELGIKRNALYKLLYDARRKLRHELETAGYTATDIQTTFQEHA